MCLADLASDAADDSLPTGPASWEDHGVMVLHGFIPEPVIDAYCERFQRDAMTRTPSDASPAHGHAGALAAGYGIGTPYLTNAEMRDVCLDAAVTATMRALFKTEMGLHLNLTGWRSTTRQWHQDRYLNPLCVGNWYVAAWFALDDIHPDAGPFEYVPGSHRWPSIDQAKMLAVMGETGDDADWPWRSEQILGPLFDREIINRRGHVERFLAKKGDVLLWHSNLCHRGSTPTDPTMERRALIAHYSAVSRRCDMAGTARHWRSDTADGTYFELGPVA